MIVDGCPVTFVVVPSAAVVVPATAPGSTSDREAAPQPAPPQTAINRSGGGGGGSGGRDMGRGNTRRSISTLLAILCGTRYRVPRTWRPLAVSRDRVAGWHRCCTGSFSLAWGCGIRVLTTMRTASTYLPTYLPGTFFSLGGGSRETA